MKKYRSRIYIVFIILLVLIFAVFSFSYILISNRYISNTASETILRMDKQVGLTVDQKVTRDYTRYKELVKDIEKTNDTTVDRYNALVERKNEFVIEGLDYKIAYANDVGFYIDGNMYTYLLGLGETDYYKYPFSIYRLQEVFGDAYQDSTNYAVFRIDDLLVLFDCNAYLYDILANVEGMPENYFLIVENNCGIAYQKNNNLVHTSLINAYIAPQEGTILADEMYKREGGYEVLLFGSTNSLFVFAPILSDLTNDSFNLVYVVDQKLVLNTVSYLRISLLVIFATIFILINLTMLVLGIIYVRREQDLKNNRLRFFFSKPFIIIVSKRGKIRMMNRTAIDSIQGYKKYKYIYDFKFYDLNEEVLKTIRLQKTITIEARDKEDNKLYLRMVPLKSIGGYTLIGEDVTVNLYEQIRNSQIALYNNVTRLPNKFILDRDLNELLASPKVALSNYALIAIDFIDFMKFNKMFGFASGDKLLREETKILKAIIDGYHASIYNIRTSIFCILFYDIRDFNQIIEWNKKATTVLSRPINIKDNFSTTVDFKMGMYSIEGAKAANLTAASIYDSAYSALERAKNSRLLKTAIYNNEFGQSLSRDQLMEQDLFTAVKNREFIMYFQPQYNTRIGKIVGFEALIRWSNPKYMHEQVENYIKMAEKNGLIMEIGKIVIEETFKFAKTIEDSGIHISMNVSPAQLLHSGFVNELEAYYDQYQLKKGMISIEITETFLMENSADVITKLRLLRDKGFGVHLDDFGIGYSSMLYLKDLPVDTIKIDKEFIKDATSDKASRNIVTRIVQLALGLDLNLVAEGVETEKQMDFLSRIGCDVIQGYLISKPVAEEGALELIKKYNGNYKLSIDDINEQRINAVDDEAVGPIARNAKKKKTKIR